MPLSALALAVWVACSIPAATLVGRALHRKARRAHFRMDDLEDDPISEASARLFGLGVDRHERLVVLRLLGLVLDEAAADGEAP